MKPKIVSIDMCCVCVQCIIELEYVWCISIDDYFYLLHRFMHIDPVPPHIHIYFYGGDVHCILLPPALFACVWVCVIDTQSHQQRLNPFEAFSNSIPFLSIHLFFVFLYVQPSPVQPISLFIWFFRDSFLMPCFRWIVILPKPQVFSPFPLC